MTDSEFFRHNVFSIHQISKQFDVIEAGNSISAAEIAGRQEEVDLWYWTTHASAIKHARYIGSISNSIWLFKHASSGTKPH